MLMDQITALSSQCDEDERELVERMILSAADYVRAVIHMRTIAINYAGRTGEELRTLVEQSDHDRTTFHNALISYVDIVNRICVSHSMPPIYTGSSLRREYGDFAYALITEIYEKR